MKLVWLIGRLVRALQIFLGLHESQEMEPVYVVEHVYPTRIRTREFEWR